MQERKKVNDKDKATYTSLVENLVSIIPLDDPNNIGNNQEEFKIRTRFAKSDKAVESLFIIPDSLGKSVGYNSINININKPFPRKTMEKAHTTFIDLSKQINTITKSKEPEKELPDVILFILTELGEVGDILELSAEQKESLIASVLDIIIENINFTIKIAGIRIPNKIVKAIVGPLIKNIVKKLIYGISDYIKKLLKKK
jgi:hypothetical protein